MAIDLSDLVDFVRAEVDAPGDNSFPDSTDAEWTIQLQGAYWELVLDGLVHIGSYTEVDGVLAPIAPNVTEFPRDMQQLVVFYAGIRIVRNKLRTMGTVFRAKAGPVEYETQNSANVMKAILDELVRKRNVILTRLSDLGHISGAYLDMLYVRDESVSYGDSWWTRY